MRLTRLLIGGFVMSIIVAISIVWTKHRIVKSLFEKFIFAIGTIVVLFILTPLLTSLGNRMVGESHAKTKAYKLLSFNKKSEQMYGLLDTVTVESDGFRVVILTDYGDESFYIKRKSSIRRTQDSIYLPMKRGGFGYYYLDEK